MSHGKDPIGTYKKLHRKHEPWVSLLNNYIQMCTDDFIQIRRKTEKFQGGRGDGQNRMTIICAEANDLIQ